MNKRQVIESEIISMINENILTYGDTVPSIRKMAKRYGISVTPVIEAYRNLELQGIIKGKTKSGFIVITPKVLPTGAPITYSPENADVSFDTGKRKNHSPLESHKCSPDNNFEAENYDFNCASMTPSMIPCDTLIQHIIKTLRVEPELLSVNPHGYDDPTLVNSIAWCMAHYRCIINKHEICITNNDFTLPLIFAIQSCLKPTQAVLLTAPCDKCHVNAARQTGHEVFYVNNSVGLRLNVNAVERILIRNPHIGCIIISPNFQPPSGISMTSEDRRILGEICAKYGVCIIEDDRNRYLSFDGVCPLPIKSAHPSNTIYIHSLSFPVMPHIQMHWTCPGKYADNFRAHRNRALASPPAFMQRSISSYLDSMQHKKDIFSIGESLGITCSRVKNAIAESFPEGVYVASPEGGCTLWVELPDIIDCTKVADAAMTLGISISTAGDYKAQGNWIVINFSTIAQNPMLIKGVYELGNLICSMNDQKI